MDPELQEVFSYVLSRGVNLFDTADSYGTGTLNGRSEQLLGEFLRVRAAAGAAPTNVHIATKLAGYPWRVTPWSMTAACRYCPPFRGASLVDEPAHYWSHYWSLLESLFTGVEVATLRQLSALFLTHNLH
jgi:aryl-alcohol dehydrogenase-like predicted oxidoreductase